MDHIVGLHAQLHRLTQRNMQFTAGDIRVGIVEDEGELEPFEFLRTIAVARILMPSAAVRLSAGREQMSDELQALAFLAGANVCWQSAGWMEGGLVTSFEKFIADTEILDLLCHQFRKVELTEADLAFDAHVEAGHGGHFFGTQHTLERFRDCFWRPTIASTENNDRWLKSGRMDHAGRAAGRWREVLESYEQPPLDDAKADELLDFVRRRVAENGDVVEVLA
jgi:trimethylamine:corrinoid methyltransferase-like protein